MAGLVSLKKEFKGDTQRSFNRMRFIKDKVRLIEEKAKVNP
jgi:hypothetical protein